MIHPTILHLMNEEHIKEMHRQADQSRLVTIAQNAPTNAKKIIKVLTFDIMRLKSSKLHIEFTLQVGLN